MGYLPIEIIEKILTQPVLSAKDIINVSLTCKKFHEIIRNNHVVWKYIFFQRWPELKNEVENISYYEELRYVHHLKKLTRKMLELMATKSYKQTELSDSDMEEWYDLIMKKKENIVYLTSDLIRIVNTVRSYDIINAIPFHIPGNLTLQYYANKVLRYLRQISLTKEWNQFISQPPNRQLLEVGSAIIAQWSQPKVEVDFEDIYRRLDHLAEMVKRTLRASCPDHPLFRATKEQLELWRYEMRDENAWCPSDCRKIIEAMMAVLFTRASYLSYVQERSQYLGIRGYDIFLNMDLMGKAGVATTIAVIFDAVGRRLGLRFEPVIFPSHFLLRFCESQHPNAKWYYIDVLNGGRILTDGICPYTQRSSRSRTKFPTCTSHEVLIRIVNDLESGARQDSRNGQVSSLRSVLELMKLVNPNITSLTSLAKLYMGHRINTAPLEQFLLTHEFDDPEQARSLVQMLRDHRPDPPEPTEPVLRPPNVKYAVGMVMQHLNYQYSCVIINWDSECMAAQDWQRRNNIKALKFKQNQPYYNVLAEDGSHRYVAEENLQPYHYFRPHDINDEVGRYFSHFYETHYVSNAQTEYSFPQDSAVRQQFYKAFITSKDGRNWMDLRNPRIRVTNNTFISLVRD